MSTAASNMRMTTLLDDSLTGVLFTELHLKYAGTFCIELRVMMASDLVDGLRAGLCIAFDTKLRDGLKATLGAMS